MMVMIVMMLMTKLFGVMIAENGGSDTEMIMIAVVIIMKSF